VRLFRSFSSHFSNTSLDIFKDVEKLEKLKSNKWWKKRSTFYKITPQGKNSLVKVLIKFFAFKVFQAGIGKINTPLDIYKYIYKNATIYVQTFHFWAQSRFLTKFLFFGTKMSIFDQNIYFWPKFWFLINMSIFDQNVDFWPKCWFWPKCQFLTKILIFDQNVDFSSTCRFLTKMLIFDQNADFWPKYRFFTKMSIFDQNADFHQDVDFWPNARSLTKIIVFNQNFAFFAQIWIHLLQPTWSPYLFL